VVRAADRPRRAEIARRVCAALRWYDSQGRPKLMSCRVGLLRLHRAGLTALPAPRCRRRVTAMATAARWWRNWRRGRSLSG
jgi:hypothetical protein